MDLHILEFQWDVSASGYQWIETESADPERASGRYLTDGKPIGASGFKVRRYNPLKLLSGLFLLFAEN